MKVLFIAPLPPPIHGQSLASEIFLKAIKTDNQVTTINTAKRKPKGIFEKLARNFEVLRILLKIYKHKSNHDIIYLTISESIPGNIKDILTYIICFRDLQKMTIHLHGGAGMAIIMKKKLLRRLNIFFLKRLKNIIVLGESHIPIFQDLNVPHQIHIVHNFAEDYLFVNESEIITKFQAHKCINILYLSNLLKGKGYQELLDGYLALNEDYRSKFKINFAGAFGSDNLKSEFMAKIRSIKNVEYHGVVSGKKKRKLLQEAQIFCLPTYYPYEGQPISILEAYAAACVVVTTTHSGIKDIFIDKESGYEVKPKEPKSITSVLEEVVNDPNVLLPMGTKNWQTAQRKFRTSIYNTSLKKILGL